MNAATILLVEDDPAQRTVLAGFLKKRGYRVLTADSADAAVAVAAGLQVHLLLTDLRLGGEDGVSLLGRLREDHAGLEAIVLTAYGSVEDAVRAMRAGAYDFLAKPVDLDHLEARVAKALERVHLTSENAELREALAAGEAFEGLIGDSAAMREVRALAARVAGSRASVMISGESGTGKGVLARAIHRASDRKDRPFVSVNLAALPEGLIEAELFGHAAGAFTGAQGAKAGRFERADGGTLFLDELGDVPLAMQVKLLEVIQSGQFERVGETQTRSADVRIITATHRDLVARIREGTFREDLYYRLNVVELRMPALRERPEDLPLLVEHFLAKHRDLAPDGPTRVAPEVMAGLARWPFPGNVRELENWLERALVLAAGAVLTAEDFPPQLFNVGGAAVAPASSAPAAPTVEGLGRPLEVQVAELESRLLMEALGAHDGNKSAAARALGLSERAMRYKLNKYGL